MIPHRGGLPHSDTSGSTPARGSPKIFAACHVLLRLLAPRHPPDALLLLKNPSRSRTTSLAQDPSNTGPITYTHFAAPERTPPPPTHRDKAATATSLPPSRPARPR